MKAGFYPRLAADGIRKNKKLFTPFILTCVGMVMMFYIIMYLAVGDTLASTFGAETLRLIFDLGSWVITVFSGIFLFYTNSFLVRRRKKEFGLYNILGMGKGNIARILFWETFIIALISVGAGLVGGIAFSKMAELGMAKVTLNKVSFKLSISLLAVKRTVEVFGAIFLLLLLSSISSVQFSSAISLMRSENIGEKPPKANWFVGALGVVILAAAYWLAVTIQDPITALLVFFLAVIMVIIGTYMIMIAGSVTFCRLLQKNKGYYYKPGHFISVSSMAYRMKRNGAGLASICILATMVLVTMASTTCLYFGGENSLKCRYPRDINIKLNVTGTYGATGDLAGRLGAELDAMNIGRENGYWFRAFSFYGCLNGTVVEPRTSNFVSLDGIKNIYLISLEDYNRVMGAGETLAPGEALLYTTHGGYKGDAISFKGGSAFRIKKRLKNFLEDGETAMNMISSIYLVVPDPSDASKGLDGLADFNGDRLLHSDVIYNFDTGKEPRAQTALMDRLTVYLRDGEVKERLGFNSFSLENREQNRQDFYGLFGSLFYLGIILSLVFIIAAVLIIYYKQISEGYEDQARFDIMRRVGMTKREIRRSINSQLLTVFFLPLGFAAMHMAFAFPIIQKLLLAFNMDNLPLFAATTGISALVFALFYLAVYKLTSNAYYAIVSGAKD